jgi:mannose-6-phosphate isomerase-like protein (cupin superfamily)
MSGSGPVSPGKQAVTVSAPKQAVTVSAYSIVHADEVADSYADSDVPGEFRSLKEALESEQVAVTLIRVPPHSDFEQGTGHFHEELEEIYILTRGTLTMRFGNEVEEVKAGSVARVASGTTRSHRNEGEEPVEMWAVSRKLAGQDATKVDDFWAPSPDAARADEPDA